MDSVKNSTFIRTVLCHWHSTALNSTAPPCLFFSILALNILLLQLKPETQTLQAAGVPTRVTSQFFLLVHLLSPRLFSCEVGTKD